MLISPFRLFLLLRNFSTEGSMILYCGLRVEWILFKSFTTSSSLLCPLSNCNITCKFTQSSLSSHSTFTTSNKGLVTFCSHYHPLWHLYIFHSSCLLSHFIALAQAHAFYEFTISSRMIPKHPVNFIPQNYFIFTSFRLRSAALYSWESLLTIHTRSKMQLQDWFPLLPPFCNSIPYPSFWHRHLSSSIADALYDLLLLRYEGLLYLFLSLRLPCFISVLLLTSLVGHPMTIFLLPVSSPFLSISSSL